jgi:hypothetical protein
LGIVELHRYDPGFSFQTPSLHSIMTRKFSLPTFVLVFASALTLAGCGAPAGDAQFTPSDDQTAEELAEDEAYEAAMEAQDAETAGQ